MVYAAAYTDATVAVTIYRARVQEDLPGAADEVSGPGSPITVRGLAPGRYRFTVSAANAAGTGPASTSSVEVVVTGPPAGTNDPPAGTSLVVDFRSTTFALDRWSLGGTILTEGGTDGTNLVTDARWRAALAALGPLTWRIPLNIDDGVPSSSERVGGVDDGAAYLDAIRAIGGTPYPIVQGRTVDNPITAAKVAAFVHYFNDNGGQHGGPIERVVLGDEPENLAGGLAAYLSELDGWIAAAKGADPAIKVSAPAASYWDTAGLQQAAAHPGVDILGYHAYDGANTDGTGFPDTVHYHADIATLRGFRAGMVGYGLEEVNFGTGAGSAPLYDWRNYTWLASVIGQVLSAGGNVTTSADLNGMLGMMNDGGTEDAQPGPKYTTFPAYWAVGMWTGMNGLFARYGSSMCPASSSLARVDVFAMDNGKVVLVNSDVGDHAVTIGLGGRTAGRYSLWQSVRSTPLAGPTNIAAGAAYADSVISLTLPAGTVSSLELSA